jgi:hypothetical protein
MEPKNQLLVATALLEENRTDPLKAGVELAVKVLTNILANPSEPKFRSLRTTNQRVKDTLWTLRGGRLTLLAAGFVESGETIVISDPVDIPRIERAVSALQEVLAKRNQQDEEDRSSHQKRVKLSQLAAQAERETMKLGISDDAASRREPGWKPQVSAAAAKGGSLITTATDIGASGDGCC